MASESWEDAVANARLQDESETAQRDAAEIALAAARSARAKELEDAAQQIEGLAWGFQKALLALRPPSTQDDEIWRDVVIWHYKKPLLGRRSRSVPLVVVPDAALVWHNTNGHEPYWSWPANLIIGAEIAPVISTVWSYEDKIHWGEYEAARSSAVVVNCSEILAQHRGAPAGLVQHMRDALALWTVRHKLEGQLRVPD